MIITFIPFITNIAGNVDNFSMQVSYPFNIVNFLNFENSSIAFITFIFVIFFSSATRLFYIFLTAKTSAKIGSYLSKRIYNTLLTKSYIEHVMQDSSFVIQMVSSNVTRTVTIISYCSLVISGSLVTLYFEHTYYY